jgi:hypothetical protein
VGDAVFRECLQYFIVGGCAINAFNGAFVEIFTDVVPVIAFEAFAQVYFAYEGGQYLIGF